MALVIHTYELRPDEAMLRRAVDPSVRIVSVTTATTTEIEVDTRVDGMLETLDDEMARDGWRRTT